jgi:lipopolysaccharide/colanic/teichoic acid biosynthesis glycosyltransferase
MDSQLTAWMWSAKRGVDVLASIVLLIFLSPLLAMLGLLVRLDSPGPAVYKQLRVGKGGRPFYLFKLRSMYAGSDDRDYQRHLDYLIKSGRNGLSAAPYQKMAGDPRITPFGAFLRRYCLDELPQLWNILKGDMSLVGPRPHVQQEVAFYTAGQRRRLDVRPGATGLWQVSDRNAFSFDQLIALDLAYIDHWNPALDIWIVVRTLLLMTCGIEGPNPGWVNPRPFSTQNETQPPPVYPQSTQEQEEMITNPVFEARRKVC